MLQRKLPHILHCPKSLRRHVFAEKEKLQESPFREPFDKTGGERGIRTPGPLRVNGFQDRRDRPLRHLSKSKTADIISKFRPQGQVRVCILQGNSICFFIRPMNPGWIKAQWQNARKCTPLSTNAKNATYGAWCLASISKHQTPGTKNQAPFVCNGAQYAIRAVRHRIFRLT